MQFRYILPALALGAMLAATPALARENRPHQSSQSNSDRSSSNAGSRSRDYSGNRYRNDNRNAERTVNRNGWNNPGDARRNTSERNRDRDWSRNSQSNRDWNRGTRRRSDWSQFRFSSRDVSRFNSSERNRWTRGRWNHGFHNNRYGWWWFLNGGWFFYNQPIYPYPAYVSSDAYYDDYYYDGGGNYGDNGDGYGNYSGAPANDGYSYYCPDPQGYYPDVRQCRSDWQRASPSSGDGRGYNDNGDNRNVPDDRGPPYDDGSRNHDDN